MFTKIESTLSDNKKIPIYIGIGFISCYLLTKLINKIKTKKKHKKILLDYVGNTPIIYLPKLSKALNS